MKTVQVRLKERSYPIVIGESLDGVGAAMAQRALGSKVLVVTNTTIARYYLKRVVVSLKKAGFTVASIALSDGEQYKRLAAVEKIYHAAVAAGLDRRSTIVALGGGVVGDIAGFAAATYLRGVSLVQIPTTLLAMVDSSVGGKTGVDLKEGKNLAGAFYQPKLVWIDPSVLATLSKRHLHNGMAEVIKYGVILDPSLFSLLEKKLPVNAELSRGDIGAVIARCCRLKADVVEQDEFETKGLREILNFGHTYAHAVETATGYRTVLHGEAVAMGMAVAGKLAVTLGMFSLRELARLETLVTSACLPLRPSKDIPFSTIEKIMRKDKKTRDGAIRFVLPRKIGSVAGGITVPSRILREVLE